MFWTSTFFFLLGAASAPVVNRILMPVVREAVKGGVLLAIEVKKTAVGVGEDLKDITAEAKRDAETHRREHERREHDE